MKTFVVQFVQKWDDRTSEFKPVGVIVADGQKLSAHTVAGGSDAWRVRLAEGFRFRDETPREFLDFLHDQNGSRTAHSLPVKIKAGSAREAADKFYARIQRELNAS